MCYPLICIVTFLRDFFLLCHCRAGRPPPSPFLLGSLHTHSTHASRTASTHAAFAIGCAHIPCPPTRGPAPSPRLFAPSPFFQEHWTPGKICHCLDEIGVAYTLPLPRRASSPRSGVAAPDALSRCAPTRTPSRCRSCPDCRSKVETAALGTWGATRDVMP